jgi:hypothetical protein
MSKTKKSLLLPSLPHAGGLAGFGSRDTRVGRRATRTPATGGRRGCVMRRDWSREMVGSGLVLPGAVRILKPVAECKWIYWRDCRLTARPAGGRGSQRGWRLQDRGCKCPGSHAFESSSPRRSRQPVQLNNFNCAASWGFLVFDQDVLSRSNLSRRITIDTWYQIIVFHIFAAKLARGSIEPGREAKSTRKCHGTPPALPPPRGRLDPSSARRPSPSSKRISVSSMASAAAARPNPGLVSGILRPPRQVPTRLRSMASCCRPLSASHGLPRICDRS